MESPDTTTVKTVTPVTTETVTMVPTETVSSAGSKPALPDFAHHDRALLQASQLLDHGVGGIAHGEATFISDEYR